MGCRLLWAGPNDIAWSCGDMEEAWIMSVCEAQDREYFLEQDLEIEADLGRWPRMTPETEPTDVEYVETVFCPSVTP